MRRTATLGLVALALAAPPWVGADTGVRVDVTAEYRSQWAQRYDGHDVRDQDLTLGFGLDAARLGAPGLSFSGLLFYEGDIDGTTEESLFKDNLDTFSNRDDVRLYRAALTYDNPAGWLRLTGGRQEVWSAETVLLDGGLVRLSPARAASVEVFGGRRVSFYRDPETEGVYGANLELRPAQGTLLQVKDLHYIENSLELSAVQTLGVWGTGRAAFRMVDWDARDLTLAAFVHPWAEAEVQLRYLRSYGNDFDYDYTSTDDEVVAALDLVELAPYADYSVTVRQGFFSTFGLGARLRRHNVIDAGDEDSQNVDFDEGALLFDLSEWPWPGLRVDAEATRWVEDRERDDLTEDNLWGFSARLQQAFGAHAVGAGVQRQAYDSDGAPRDSRAFDVWARVGLTQWASLHLRYERAVDDLYRAEGVDALHEATARLNLAF